MTAARVHDDGSPRCSAGFTRSPDSIPRMSLSVFSTSDRSSKGSSVLAGDTNRRAGPTHSLLHCTLAFCANLGLILHESYSGSVSPQSGRLQSIRRPL